MKDSGEGSIIMDMGERLMRDLGIRSGLTLEESVCLADDNAAPETRFDQGEYWITAHGECIAIDKMETTHIMNTIRLMLRKPLTVQSLSITDLEQDSMHIAWSLVKGPQNLLAEGIHNVTSMTIEQTMEYVLNSELFCAFARELEHRGVNYNTFIINVKEEMKTEPKIHHS